MSFDLTEADDFTEKVRVPEDGIDPRTAASLYPALQALSNRSKNLLGRVSKYADAIHEWTKAQAFKDSVGFFGAPVIAGTDNELRYADTLGVANTRDRTIVLPHSAFIIPQGPDGTQQWFYPSDDTGIPAGFSPGYVSKLNTLVPLKADFQIVTGAPLKQVRAAFLISGACTVGMSIGYDEPAENVFDGTTVSVGSQATGTRTTSGVITHNVVSFPLLPSIASPHDAALRTRTLKFFMTNPTGMTTICVKWVKLVFGDPGPRNF